MIEQPTERFNHRVRPKLSSKIKKLVADLNNKSIAKGGAKVGIVNVLDEALEDILKKYKHQ